MCSENAISHVHVNKRGLGLVTTILAVLQNNRVMRRAGIGVGSVRVIAIFKLHTYYLVRTQNFKYTWSRYSLRLFIPIRCPINRSINFNSALLAVMILH